MSLKPVLVVIPQRTLRFLSGFGSTRSGCPPVLVARRQANPDQQCNSERELSAQTRREIVPISVGGDSSQSPHHQIEPSESVSEEGEGEGRDGGGTGGSGDEAMESEDAVGVAPSRSVKHKAVEQRRKKKISDAVQQLLEALRPPSPTGKMTRADILERAVDKINTLKEENKKLKEKIDSLPQPGKETELYGELSKQITEFLALKSQLEDMEKQRSESHDSGVESHDLEIESHDSVQDHDEAISSGEPLSAAHANPSPLAPLPDPSSTVIAATTSRDSASTTASDSSPITRSCSVAHVHIHSADSGPSDAIPTCTCTSSRSNVIAEARIASNELTGEAASRCVDIRAATEAPPPVSAHQPWPVTSILSQGNTTSHCQHSTTTINHVVPTSCHGNGLTTSGGQSRNTSAHVSPVSNVSAHIQNISPVSSVSTHSHFHHPSSSVRMINSSMSSSTQQRSVVTNHQFRASRNNATPHSRAGSGLATLHGNYQCHHNSSGEPQLQVIRYSRERQREVGCSGYSPSNQTTQERYRSTTTGTHVQPHTSAIVQPWVESSHRPRPLHHVTNTTPLPRMSPQAQYNPLHVQHHQEQHRRTTHSHTERFMPYPYPRMNHHSSPSTFSPGSWSHDNHVITPVGTSGCDVEPQGRSYASSPYDLQHHPPPLGGTRNSYTSNFDYSRNYSATQGHPSSTQGVGHSSWMPYFTPPSQQNCSRNSGMMSHDSQATPPYPIQPHPHGSGSSGTSPAVWRPYSERTRSSGFCLADILSLPSDTEATPLTLDVTPPTGHHSFLVNRLLDDI